MILKGENISGQLRYGYVKNPNDKHKIIVDPEAAEVVKLIFELTAQGKAMVEQIDELHQEIEQLKTELPTEDNSAGEFDTQLENIINMESFDREKINFFWSGIDTSRKRYTRISSEGLWPLEQLRKVCRLNRYRKIWDMSK